MYAHSRRNKTNSHLYHRIRELKEMYAHSERNKTNSHPYHGKRELENAYVQIFFGETNIKEILFFFNSTIDC